MKTPIPNWLKDEEEYPLNKLVRLGVFPNMIHYNTVLKNLIHTDVIKHRVLKRYDGDKEMMRARRYYVKGFSLRKYLNNYYNEKSETIEIHEGGGK